MSTTDREKIHIPFPITTERLLLRNIMPGDGAAMFEAKKESFEELRKWMPWAKELGTLEDSEKVSVENYEKFLKREDIMILGFSKDDGRLIVSTGLHQMDWDLRIFEIGYWVRTSEAGNGYATESTNALIRYAFSALAASKVAICHAGGNAPSARVIEKLGFEKEGVFRRDARLPDGTVTDHHWYARFDDKNLTHLKVTW